MPLPLKCPVASTRRLLVVIACADRSAVPAHTSRQSMIIGACEVRVCTTCMEVAREFRQCALLSLAS